MTHTPTPYKVEQGQGYHCGRWVITAEGMPPHSPLAHVSQICGPEESYPDAQFIVTALNAHEELVAALKGLLYEPMAERTVYAAKKILHTIEKGG